MQCALDLSAGSARLGCRPRRPLHLGARRRWCLAGPWCRHFAHRPARMPTSSGESERHWQMKKQTGLLLRGMGCELRCEIASPPNTADLWRTGASP